MERNRNVDLPSAADLKRAVIDAVMEAGAMLRAEFHRPEGRRGSGGHAEIDKEIEALLKQRLLGAHPCDWRGEELPPVTTGHADVWVVDPQDGTRAFLKGLRGSAVSVALVRNGRPILGVVYAPTAPDDTGDWFEWFDGYLPNRNGVDLRQIGAQGWMSTIDYAFARGMPRWLPRKGDPDCYDSETVIAFNQDAADFAAHNHAALAPARVVAIPSIAYRLALAAAGEVDIGISMTYGLDAYDVAAGHALLIGVGGVLVQLDGKPVTYTGSMRYNGCIGGRARLAAQVVSRKPTEGKREKRNPARHARRINDAGPLSRAQGALLGQLAGDSLGSLVEFQSAAAIHSKYPHGVTELQNGGHWGTLAGQPTDDSEMALALARSIVAQGGFDAGAVGQAYVEWGESNPFDMGGTTRAGLNALRGRGRANAESQSNGALMRVSPIGIHAWRDLELAARLAATDAALTHPNPVCVAASAAFAAAIAFGISNGGKMDMCNVAVYHAGQGAGADAVRECLYKAVHSVPQDFKHNEGWVLIALQNAFHHLLYTNSLQDAVIATVASGGDTDTNAAICGALMGALHGREEIPLSWRRQILTCRTVQGAGVKHPRPMTCWPDDAMDLAEALMVANPVRN